MAGRAGRAGRAMLLTLEARTGSQGGKLFWRPSVLTSKADGMPPGIGRQPNPKDPVQLRAASAQPDRSKKSSPKAGPHTPPLTCSQKHRPENPNHDPSK